MALFLGVDGGQSSTVALIADESGRMLGAGRGGPCNHVAEAEGRAKFTRAMEECIGAACAEAGLNPAEVSFRAACLGFSGGTADKDNYSRQFIRSEIFKITHDAEIALTGATGGEAGIIVIAGTGSIAFGKDAAGRTGRAGGWGYLFGDEGGAFDIARQALRSALAMEEGWGPATTLRKALLESSEVASANGLLHHWYSQFDRRHIARLAPLVDSAAHAGDLVARAILQDAGRHLAGLITKVHGQLFAAGANAFISYVGGVFASDFITGEMRSAVQEKLACSIDAPTFPPAAGAVLEALRLAGIKVGLSNIPTIKS